MAKKYKLNPACLRNNGFNGIYLQAMRNMFGEDFMNAEFEVSGNVPEPARGTSWSWNSGSFIEVKDKRKKKNLFKAGDRVKIVKDLVRPNDPKDVGMYGVIESRKLLKDARSVNDVRLPYRIRFDDGTETDANAQELEAVDSHPQGTATAADCQAPVKSISTDEVAKIVQEEVASAEARIIGEVQTNQFNLVQRLNAIQKTVGILARELEEARRENADNQVNEDQ